MSRILVSGSRDWKDLPTIQKAFDHYKPTVVIEGDASGADKIAGEEAGRRGIELEVFPAAWEVHDMDWCKCNGSEDHTYCAMAGPKRNQEMLELGVPDLVLAFHPFISKSRGTRDMVQRARKMGVPVIIIAKPLSTAEIGQMKLEEAM